MSRLSPVIDIYVGRRQLRWLGHVSRMDMARLPRRMLTAWVPHARPAGAPRLTYGRSVAKAMDVFDLHRSRWPALAEDRVAWRAMLRDGAPPAAFRQTPPVAAALPISITRPTRAAAARTNAKIDATVAALKGVTR